MLADQGDQYEDDDGAPRVSVKDFDRVRSENGIKRSSGVEMKTQIGEGEYMANKKRLRAKTSAGVVEQQARPSPSAGSGNYAPPSMLARSTSPRRPQLPP